jgi:hypothetical protein
MQYIERPLSPRTPLLVLLFFVFWLGAAYSPATAADRTDVIADSVSATVSGFIRDSASGEPIIGATVQVKAIKKGARTNKSGYYVLYLPPGEHLLEVTSIGYSTYREDIRVRPNEKRSLEIKLRTSAIQGGEVLVEQDRDREREAPRVSVVQIKPAQIEQMPKAGEADLFRTLQLLPGVKTASEISSGLYIRGGSPDQNLILLDGSVLYNPSHFFGFFSTFNSDAIKDVELIKGGYPAEYGGRLSAVLSVTNKDGDREATHGKFTLGLISSRATVETPLGTGAVTLSGRRTYLDAILNASGLKDELGLPDYNFYDLNAKITQNPGSNDKVSLSGYLGRDLLDFSDPAAGATVLLKWGNRSGALDWTHIFKEDLFARFNLNASSYFSNLTLGASGEDLVRDNSILDYTFNGSLEYSPNEDHQFKFGVQSTLYDFKFLVKYGASPPNANVDLSPFYGAVYLQDEWKMTEEAALTAGLRVDKISSRPEIGIDPRLAMRYILNDDVTLKASFGIYHQYLRLATNPNISFFDVWLPVDSTQPPSSSEQYILGVATTPWDGYTLEVEAYYKNQHNVVELRPNIVSGDKLSDVFFLGRAYSYGIEFFLQRQIGDLTGWLGYTLAWTRRVFPEINNGETFAPTYDRRNDVNLVLTYRLNDRWTIGSTFVYGTGQAYTQAVAAFYRREPDHSGSHVTIPGKTNALRLPSYHRLDVSATYSFSLWSDTRNASVNFDIYNAYNYRNVWFKNVNSSTNPATIEDIKLLPILPTVGIQVSF